jgi:hypothetical protein
MRERSGVGQIVNGDEVDVRITDSRAINVSPDTTKSIDSNLHRHLKNLLQTE